MDKGKQMVERFKGWPKWVRIPIGVILIVGGILGFLPILGFWMIPLGLAVLAIDIPAARRATRWLRRQIVRLSRHVHRGRRNSGT